MMAASGGTIEWGVDVGDTQCLAISIGLIEVSMATIGDGCGVLGIQVPLAGS